MKLGNLDSLNLGMGLVATPGQVIPARNNAFAGFEGPSLQDVSPILAIVGIILLARLIW